MNVQSMSYVRYYYLALQGYMVITDVLVKLQPRTVTMCVVVVLHTMPELEVFEC